MHTMRSLDDDDWADGKGGALGGASDWVGLSL